ESGMQVFTDDVFGNGQECEEQANESGKEERAELEKILQKKGDGTEQDGINDESIGNENNFFGIFIRAAVFVELGKSRGNIPAHQGNQQE
ncbi:hypothetical protein, partial [Citrobacter koseri]|uniref:hypothetical protein n=1 Tax=Citrobacter koseri TaxID=545 RepID=UPI0022326D23|nr:hypothetical protein [Citrobacter koseri]